MLWTQQICNLSLVHMYDIIFHLSWLFFFNLKYLCRILSVTHLCVESSDSTYNTDPGLCWQPFFPRPAQESGRIYLEHLLHKSILKISMLQCIDLLVRVMSFTKIDLKVKTYWSIILIHVFFNFLYKVQDEIKYMQF